MPEGMESRPPPRRKSPVLATVIAEPPRPVAAQIAKVEEPPVLLPLSAAPQTSSPVMAPKREQTTSPLLQEVLRLLRSPKTAGTALVLHEILDRPRYPRRR